MAHEVTSTQLKTLLEHEKIFLLDIRNRADFERARVEGGDAASIMNAPLLELIEKGGKVDAKDSIFHSIKTYLAEKLPKNQKIVVVCARGKSSIIVTDILAELDYDASSLAGGMTGWEACR